MNMRWKLMIPFTFIILLFIIAVIIFFHDSHYLKNQKMMMHNSGGDKKEWTLAFYLDGDNSLEKEQVKNLKEICAGASALGNANIVVFFDRDDKISHDYLFTTWKGTRVFNINASYREVIKTPLSVPLPHSVEACRFEKMIVQRLTDSADRDFIFKHYKLKGGRYVLKQISDEDEKHLHYILKDKIDYLLPVNGKEYMNLDATDGSTLSRFISFVKDNFISDHYAVIIAGHGNGWFTEDDLPPMYNRGSPPGYSRDFDVPEIRSALINHHPDVLILDVCFMGDIETAWELKDCADYLVLQQTTIPSRGNDYTIFLHRLGSKWFLSPEDVAIEAVEVYKEIYNKKAYPISTTAVKLDEYFILFVRELQQYLREKSNKPSIKKAAIEAIHIMGWNHNRGKMADLVKFISDNTNTDLEKYLPGGGESFIIGHFVTNANLLGLSIYLPKTINLYEVDNERYKERAFSRDFPDAWVKVLPMLYE